MQQGLKTYTIIQVHSDHIAMSHTVRMHVLVGFPTCWGLLPYNEKNEGHTCHNWMANTPFLLYVNRLRGSMAHRNSNS